MFIRKVMQFKGKCYGPLEYPASTAKLRV